MITCGFFNSVNGDRKYNAEQMNNPYHRIVSDGVFAQPSGQPSNDFKVYGDGTMNVLVNAGEGIFHGKWAKNDASIVIPLPVPDVSNARIDSVVFRVDYNTRTGSVELKVGTPSASPSAPLVTRSEMIMEYRLANILVRANSQGITDAEITDTRAGSDCGFITHLLQQADITAIYTQWQSQFEDWFREVKETLSTSTLIRSYTSQYITLTQGETEIPIQISQFKRSLDILQVFVNGLRLIPDIEYTVDSNTQITLAKDVDINTPVSFVVYKSVDGSDAETVVQQVYELQTKLNVTKVTADNGAVKISVSAGADVLQAFVNAGTGCHTMYSPAGATGTPKNAAFRYIGHITGSGNGWLLAFQADGSIFSNYLVGGTWKGWRTVHEVSPAALYFTENGVYPNPGVEITPAKKLSECQHGWQLVFNAYQDGSLDSYVQSVCIPKRSNHNAAWDGENYVCPLIYLDGTVNTIFKQFMVFDDKLISANINSAEPFKVMVLRAIYEY